MELSKLRKIQDRINRDLPYFTEDWVTEAIDATLWTSTDPVTNPSVIAVADQRIRFRMWLVANEAGRLVSVHRYRVTPNQYDDNSLIPRKFILEFEMKLTDVTNMDNTTCFWGLTEATTDTAAANDIAGFMLAADVLQTITDDGGVQAVTTTFGETLTNWNKFKIVVEPLQIVFYLNDAVIATHSTAASTPDDVMFINFFMDTEAGVGPTYCDLGWIRAWHEEQL